MSKTVRKLASKHSEWSVGEQSQFTTLSKGAMPGRDLSFVPLRNVVNTYPDTGESGDAYDKEMAEDHRSSLITNQSPIVNYVYTWIVSIIRGIPNNPDVMW